MKGKHKKLAMLLLACTLSIGVIGMAAGCKKPDTPPAGDPVTVTLSESEISLDKYDTYQLAADVTGGGSVTWASSDTDIVMVDSNGLLTAVEVGTATITASAGDASDTCAVTVVLSEVAPVLVVDETEISVEKDGQYTLSASVYWKGDPVTGASYTWTASSGADVASVAEAGEGSFTVSGLKVGTAVYTVSTTVHELVLTETVTVTVVNSDIRFEFGDAYTFDKDEHAYRTEMKLSLTDTPSAQPIDVAVYDNDDLVQSPGLEWTVEDESVVSEENGVLTAIAAGETRLSASYDGVQVSILATVSLQEVTLSDHLGQIERLDGTGTAQVTLESDLAGTIQKAYFADGTDVLAVGGVSGKTLTLEKAKLPKYDEDMGDDVQFTVETDKAIYLCTVDLYTQIIDDATELNGFVVLGESVYAEENAANNTRHYGGYFILGDDIDYDHALYMLDDTDNATRVFYGTFDGKNHVISNMGTDSSGAIGSMGLFQNLGDGAVVRNIAFENLARTSGVQYGALIARYTEKRDDRVTIENIYIHVNKVYSAVTAGQWNSIILNGGGWNWTNIAPLSNLTVRNVVICADEFAEGPGETSVLGHVEVNGGGIQNVYTYGIGSVPINYNDSEFVRNASDVFGAYASRADMVAAENDYSGFYAAENDGFWTEFNGLPYPARLAETQAMVTFTVDGDVYAEQIVNKGTDMTLPDSPVKDGYAFVGWALGDSETAYDFAANGYEVNDDMSFTALWMQAVESANVGEAEVVTSVLTPGFDTATVGGYTQSYTIDISDVKDSVSGDLTQLIVGTHTYTNNFSYADGIITVSHAPEIGDYGYTNFTAVFAGDPDPISVTGQILFITLKISDPDEFRSFLRIGENIYAEENTVNGTRRTGGYFVLDQDIDFAHGQYMMYEASGRTFYGTLDGRGHVIKDLGPADVDTTGAISYVGLFERFGDGAVVRNIAFENFSRNSGMNYSSVFAASLERSDDHVTLENIYLHFTKLFYANNAGDWSSILLNGHWNWANIEPFSNVKVNNIIICADEMGGGSGTTDIFGHFEKNSTNIQNVYAYGLGNIMISKNDDKTDRNAKKDIFALYATREDMIAAAPERDFSDFYAAEADGFWVEDADGLPYPARLAELLATVEFVVDGETYDSQTIEKGETFTLPQEPTKEGYAFIGWALGDGDTAYDFDGNGYTANDDMTFTALWEAAAESSIVSEAEVVTSVLTPGFDTATAGGYAQSYTIDVSDIAESISGTLTALTVGEKEYSTGIGYADGTITVSHALAIGDYGYQNYTAVFENEGETLYVTGQVLFITLKISDFDEFTSFLRIGENVYAEENASEGTRHTGGYFVLDQDIDFAHQKYMMWEADGRIFYGTLDGRGHVVKDLGPTDTTQGALSYAGLFQCFGDGATVRNIAFENFSRNSGMNFSSVFASSLENSGAHVTLENIYIHFTKLFYASKEGEQSSILLNGGWNWANIAPFSNVKVNNIIICADEMGSGSGTTDIFGQFAKDSANIQNVYTYGLGNITLSKNDDRTSGSDGDVFGLYAAKSDMIAAANDYADFYAPEADGFWAEDSDGLPYPAGLSETATA